MRQFKSEQIAALSKLVDKDRFSTGRSNRELHLHDISAYRGMLPAAVIWPLSTGEHGIGIGKRKFMELEHGKSYQPMRQIKVLLDPKGLMNPDKIFINSTQ